MLKSKGSFVEEVRRGNIFVNGERAIPSGLASLLIGDYLFGAATSAVDIDAACAVREKAYSKHNYTRPSRDESDKSNALLLYAKRAEQIESMVRLLFGTAMSAGTSEVALAERTFDLVVADIRMPGRGPNFVSRYFSSFFTAV